MNKINMSLLVGKIKELNSLNNTPLVHPLSANPVNNSHYSIHIGRGVYSLVKSNNLKDEIDIIFSCFTKKDMFSSLSNFVLGVVTGKNAAKVSC